MALHERVYMMDATDYIRSFLFWPSERPSDQSDSRIVRVADVTRIEESPHRLPARFASALYEAGESSMGGYCFSVQFVDGRLAYFTSGNLLDFITYPRGLRPKDIVAVTPHARGEDPIPAPDFSFCLYRR